MDPPDVLGLEHGAPRPMQLPGRTKSELKSLLCAEISAVASDS